MAEDLVEIREQVYRDSRSAEDFARFHERTRRRGPDWMYQAVRVVLTLYVMIPFRARGLDSDKVPPRGALILAPNHSSFMDHFFTAALISRKVQFMAKSQLFHPPLKFVFNHGGVPGAAAPAMRTPSRQPTRSSLVAARSACTARVAAHGPAGSPTAPSRASAAWRSSRGRRSSRLRSTAR
jgi:hypothetical protein